MSQLLQDIDNCVELTAFTLRKLFLGFFRAYFSGRLLVHPEVLKNFKYTGNADGIIVDLVDLENKDKLDYSTGIYLTDGATTYEEHSIGGRGESNLFDGSTTYQVEGTHSLRAMVIADSADEAGMLADNIFFFLLSLKGMLGRANIASMSEIRVTGQGKTTRLDNKRFHKDVAFHVKAHHAVINLPETHLLQTISIKTFVELFFENEESEPVPTEPDYAEALVYLTGLPVAYLDGQIINYYNAGLLPPREQETPAETTWDDTNLWDDSILWSD